MQFEWDDRKALTNRIKHGVDFELSKRFQFRTALVEFDDDLDYGEERLLAIGLADTKLVTMIFVERDEQTIRVISLRRATKPEERRFAEHLIHIGRERS